MQKSKKMGKITYIIADFRISFKITFPIMLAIVFSDLFEVR